MEHEERNEKGLNRREFIRKAAITGAVAWAAPVIQSIAATPAYAQTGSACAHSPATSPTSCQDVVAGTCMGNCQTKCCQDHNQAEGGGCAAICNANCSRGTCPPQYCNLACWSCSASGPSFNC